MEIWKYGLGPGQNVLGIPVGAALLTVQVQGSRPMLWAKVDPAARQEEREIHVLATGEEFDDAGFKYINTFQISGGSLIFHAFEKERP